ncbi:unnamed protein product [Linum trigynum]|uniref:Uncharacterized protein n=1 Tax=Linum trigynum TaxID=586398 RepID=A0AAV2CVH4_9ROSI
MPCRPKHGPTPMYNQECLIGDSHHYPLPESKFEDQVISVEDQKNPFYDLAWHLALKTGLEDMDGKVREEVVEEEVKIEEREDLDCSQGEEESE